MTPIEKAAHEALDELQIEQFRLENRERERFTYEQKLEIILDHLEPVQAELYELESKRVDSIQLEQIVDSASNLLPDYKGLPDPCLDALARINKVQAELDAKDKRIIELMEAGVAKDFELLHKDKLLQEARGIINNSLDLSRHWQDDSEECVPECARCKAQDWLARVNNNSETKQPDSNKI